VDVPSVDVCVGDRRDRVSDALPVVDAVEQKLVGAVRLRPE
jgi:hypothetical protein